MSITKADLNKALEAQSKSIVKAIDITVDETIDRKLDEKLPEYLGPLEQRLLNRIDRLDQAQIDARLRAVEEKLGIHSPAL